MLDAVEDGELTDHTIEDNDDDRPGKASSSSAASDLVRRWMRISHHVVNLVGTVECFN